jgi:hypothetical protein
MTAEKFLSAAHVRILPNHDLLDAEEHHRTGAQWTR